MLVDLLVAGKTIPRSREAVYPSPDAVESSEDDPTIVGLAPLKLYARRHQDRADVVALLKGLSDGEYLELERKLEPAQRNQLVTLRTDALEELAWEKQNA